ncbi:pilin [Cellvibrio japonicus]
MNREAPADANTLGAQFDGSEEKSCLGRVKTVGYTKSGTDGRITATFYANGDTQDAACGGAKLTVPADLDSKTVVVDGVVSPSGAVKFVINSTVSTVDDKYLPKLD